MLRVGKRIFVGRSNRTNMEGIEELARIMKPIGYRVIPVSTKDSLHLKTACTAIDDETLFVQPDWLDLEPFAGFNLVNTPPEEPWAANLLRVGDTVCVQADCPRSVELLTRLAKRVELINTSELRKAEAGLTCSSLIFESDK